MILHQGRAKSVFIVSFWDFSIGRFMLNKLKFRVWKIGNLAKKVSLCGLIVSLIDSHF